MAKIVSLAALGILLFFVIGVIAYCVRDMTRRRDSEPIPMLPVPAYKFLYDYELCVGGVELRETIQEINKCGYNLVCVSQNDEVYTVFFRRFANENP